MISAIVAVDNDFGIGYNNSLLERIPEDLKNFKKITLNKIVVMGRKTFESLGNKPLPKRLNIIITNQEPTNLPFYENIQYISLKDFIPWMINNKNNSDFFIIGGSSIYNQLLPYCDSIYLTKIYKKHERIDSYFPRVDKDPYWKGQVLGEKQKYKDIFYQFFLYSKL